MEDLIDVVRIAPPTEWGFYRYSGGHQLMIFMLDGNGQWWAWFQNNPTPEKCEWGYIEQALSVYTLIKIEGDGS